MILYPEYLEKRVTCIWLNKSFKESFVRVCLLYFVWNILLRYILFLFALFMFAVVEYIFSNIFIQFYHWWQSIQVSLHVCTPGYIFVVLLVCLVKSINYINILQDWTHWLFIYCYYCCWLDACVMNFFVLHLTIIIIMIFYKWFFVIQSKMSNIIIQFEFKLIISHFFFVLFS